MPVRKPDYNIGVMNKESGKKLPSAGGGWLNQDGSITLSINPCVVLTGDANLAIALFPVSSSMGKPKNQSADVDEERPY